MAASVDGADLQNLASIELQLRYSTKHFHHTMSPVRQLSLLKD
jgi:hypothetical protein